jgi:hypothetical protein
VSFPRPNTLTDSLLIKAMMTPETMYILHTSGCRNGLNHISDSLCQQQVEKFNQHSNPVFRKSAQTLKANSLYNTEGQLFHEGSKYCCKNEQKLE